jgi:glycosyltransferase involved in cell wall biosynthesis
MTRFTDGIPVFDLHDKYSHHDLIILSASRLSREKNIVMVIRAMRKVVKRYPRALLLIVGSGPELDNLRSRVVEYKLLDNVVFEPWTKDIVSYYKTSDIFVLTSNYEGGARTPVESVSSGLPIVMTDVPPAGELVLDDFNGFIVNIDDADKMAEKIIELISDKDKHLKFRENSLKMARGFITKEAYFRLYYKALVDAQTSASIRELNR